MASVCVVTTQDLFPVPYFTYLINVSMEID